MGRLGQGFDLAFDLLDIGVFTFQHLFGFDDGFFRGFDVFLAQLLFVLPDGFFGAVDQRIELVAGVDRLTPLLVGFGVGFSILHHVVDFAVTETGVVGDGDLLFLAGALVLSGHVEDTVGVDVKSDVDLRHTPGRCGNPVEVKFTQRAVVFRHFPFPLKHVDFDAWLVVRCGGERFTFARGDGGIPLDQPGGDSAQGFDSQRQRRDVQQEDIFHVSGKNSGLNRGTERHHFVRVDAAVRLFLKQIFDDFLDFGNPGGTSHQNRFVYLVRFLAGVLERFLTGPLGAVQQIVHHRLEFSAR